MKTLHFDARFIRTDHHDGISRFSVELINEFHKKIEVVAIICDKKQLEFLPKGISFIEVNKPESPKEFFIAKKLNKLGVSFVYSPMQVMGSFGRKYKLVLTLHDLIYYRHRTPPQDLSLLLKIVWRLYHLTYWPQRLLLNRADAIVTVSETTKSLIVKHKLTRKPVSVVYNAAAMASVAQSRIEPISKKLVYIGSFMPYKNVETLIRGVGLTKGYSLHLLGKISEAREAELTKLAEQCGAQVIFHHGVSDEEYLKHLDEAFALVTASKDEGFGIPLVEAMSQATPVVVSDLEIFREVAGEAGHYFSAESPGALAKQLDLLAQKGKWGTYSRLALKQSHKFSWKNSADRLLEVFNSLEN